MALQEGPRPREYAENFLLIMLDGIKLPISSAKNKRRSDGRTAKAAHSFCSTGGRLLDCAHGSAHTHAAGGRARRCAREGHAPLGSRRSGTRRTGTDPGGAGAQRNI